MANKVNHDSPTGEKGNENVATLGTLTGQDRKFFVALGQLEAVVAAVVCSLNHHHGQRRGQKR
jgi:hypothetical protein